MDGVYSVNYQRALQNCYRDHTRPPQHPGLLEQAERAAEALTLESFSELSKEMFPHIISNVSYVNRTPNMLHNAHMYVNRLCEVFCIYNGKRSQGTDPKVVKIDLRAWDYQRVCYLLYVFCNEKRDMVKGF